MQHLDDEQAVADGAQGAVDGDDAARALLADVEVVGDGARGRLEHAVRGQLVQEELAEGGQEGAGRVRLEAAVDVVGEEEDGAELLEGEEGHVAVACLQPFQERLRVDVGHSLGTARDG